MKKEVLPPPGFIRSNWPYIWVDKNGNLFVSNPDKRTRRDPKIYIDKDGYERIWALNKELKKKFILKHRIILLTLNPPEDLTLTVNHKDGNKRNNHPSNLEWLTSIENNKHSFYVLNRKGLKGEMSGRSKLKERDVIEIRKMCDEKIPVVIISNIYNISLAQVNRIKRRLNWGHLK